MKNQRRIFIKLGTSTLTAGRERLDKTVMLEIARAVYLLTSQGHQVALVSSGAVAAGREALNDPELPSHMGSKQMLAAVGQVRLIKLWEDLFDIFKLKIGQLLLTRADLENRERYLNARDTLKALFDNGIIPIINENDAVSVSEIKVGDNDNLAALSAVLADADTVILLTDQKGLYTADPRSDPSSELIREVDNIDAGLLSRAGGAGSAQGTGGMATKLNAARVATAAGVELIIASGADPAIITDLVQGRGEGTFFKPATRPILARKAWISAATKPAGTLVVDDGARRALTERGSSLLPSGIVEVRGDFMRGATVDVLSRERGVFARGLVRYSAAELTLLRRRRSAEIAGVLGFSHGDEAIHRDDLVILEA